MDFTDLLFILLLAALAGFWLDSLRALETARHAGKRACNSAGVQFLDDTVTVTALTLRRNAVGHTGDPADLSFRIQRYRR